MLTLGHLRCMNAAHPMGIDVPPYFSWELRSERQDTVQIAYALRVFCEDTPIWDSGIVQSPQDAYVPYGGPALQGRRVYTWCVTVWDNHGGEAAAEGIFETGILEQSEWQAKWVASPFPVGKRGKKHGQQPPAVLFCRNFTLTGEVRSARLYATCHGIYHAYVNGENVDTGAFAPEFTAYRDFLMYQSYDVTQQLRPGENNICLYVGDGWLLGANTQQPDFPRKRHAVFFQLMLTLTDGREEIIASDETVQASNCGPVRYSDLFQGECYDARQHSIELLRTARWRHGVVKTESLHNLCAQLGEGVGVVRRFPVRELIHSPRGEWILDFGQNMAGRLRMKLDYPAGTEVHLAHCEVLDPDGNYYSRVGVGEQILQTDVVICDGREFVYEPLFTFHGFRYVRVSGIGQPDPACFEAIALSTDKENLGTFQCSNEKLNRLVENTRWSQYSNMLSIPTDCPQREKAGWTGDVGVYATTALLSEDVTMMYTRWLRSLALQQNRAGHVPYVVPKTQTYLLAERLLSALGGQPRDVSSAGWGDACILTPWAMYQVTGNALILRRQYPCMKKWVDSVLERARKKKPRGCKRPAELEQYLWDTGFHYGEWLIPSQSTDSDVWKLVSATKISAAYVAPIYGWISTDLLARIAGILGNTEDEKLYREKAGAIRNAIMTGLLNEQGDPPADLMGAYAMFLYYDLVPKAHAEKFKEKLVQSVVSNDYRLDTGFLTTPILLDTLCRIGRMDLAYRLLYQRQCPSWLFEVDMGATTMWETWYAYTPDGQPADLSFNHYAFGCVADWIYRTIGGIRAEAPGFSKVLIRPEPDESLLWAQRSYHCVHGEIRTHWEKKDGSFTLTVTIPCNSAARVILPDGSTHTVGSGTYTYTCPLR